MLNSILTFAWLEQPPFVGFLNRPTQYMYVEDGEGRDIRILRTWVTVEKIRIVYAAFT